MAKASKAAKGRVRRANMGKSARVLADFELITQKRYEAILRALKSGTGLR